MSFRRKDIATGDLAVDFVRQLRRIEKKTRRSIRDTVRETVEIPSVGDDF